MHLFVQVLVCQHLDGDQLSDCREQNCPSKCTMQPSRRSWALELDALEGLTDVHITRCKVVDWLRLSCCVLAVVLLVAAPRVAHDDCSRALTCGFMASTGASLLLRSDDPQQVLTDFPVLVVGIVTGLTVWCVGLSPEHQGVYVRRMIKLGALAAGPPLCTLS